MQSMRDIGFSAKPRMDNLRKVSVCGEHPCSECAVESRKKTEKEEAKQSDLKEILFYAGIGALTVVALDLIVRLITSHKPKGTIYIDGHAYAPI